MASSDSGASAKQPDPIAIRDRLIDLVARQEFQQLVNECQTHGQIIFDNFAEWKVVPENFRQDQSQLDRYAKGIITIAQLFAQNGYPELITMLSGDPDNPLTQWQNDLHQAQSLMSQFRFAEAVQLLNKLIENSRNLDGSGVDQLLPVTYGYLGQSYFQSGEMEKARTATEEAMNLCEQNGEQEGVLTYAGNLYEIYRYLGQTSSAADMAGRYANLVEKQGDAVTAARFRKQAKIVRAGEPLNRVVVEVGEHIYELDEISQVQSQEINLNFHRNRPSLRLAIGLTDQGEDLAGDGKYEQALELFKQAADADKYDPHSHYLAGLTLLHLKRYPEAVESYQQTEQLAPGWYHCRADLWLAQQLADNKVDHEIFLTLHLLEDGNMSPAKNIEIAEQAIDKAPELAPLYLHYGKNLVVEDRDDEAEKAFRTGLKYAAEPDIRTRLLVQLGSVIDDEAEKKALLNEALTLNGNLIAAAMAAFILNT